MRAATAAVVSVLVAWGIWSPTPLMVSATELEPGYVTSIPAPAGVTVSGAWGFNSLRGEAVGWGVDASGYSVVLRHTLTTGSITAQRTAVVGDGNARIVHSHNSTAMAYVVTQRATPGDRIIAVDQTTMSRTAAYTLGSTESSVTTFTTGTAGNVGYVTTGSNPTKVLRLATPAMTLLSSATLPAGIGSVTASTIYGGYLWLLTGSNPVKLVAVNPTTLAVVSTTSLDGVASGLTSLAMVGSVAYLGSETGTGRIVAVDLASPGVVGAVTLAADEQGARLGFLDSATGMLHVATASPSGTRLVTVDSATLRVVGRSLTDAAGTPTAVYGSGRHVFVANAASATALHVFTRSPAPAAPTGVTVTPSDGAVEISWAAADSTEPVLDYEVTAEGSSGTVRCTSIDTNCRIAPLVNGTVYRITVTVRSTAGVGTAATMWGAPFTVPGSPRNPHAVRGDGTISVSWSMPPDGGSAITGYRAVAEDPTGARTECRTTELTCVFSELTNGVAYSVALIALNAAGESATITAGTIIPATVPGAPESVTATRGDGRLHITWTASADDGGDPITAYEVFALQGDEVIVSRCSAEPASRSCVLTGLTNGLAYRVAVTAANTVGASTAAEGGVHVPATTPDAPTDLRFVRGDRSVTVSWAAPVNTGGLRLDGYLISAVAPDSSETLCRTEALHCTVDGLTNGVEYRIRITAANDVGESPATEAAEMARPATHPGEPRNITVSASDHLIAVTWSTPDSDGGEPVSGYRAFANDSEGRLVGICDTTSLGCPITGLANGAAVTITVIAHNAVGDGSTGPASAPATPATVPSAPTGLVAVRGNGTITAEWVLPESDGGSPVTEFRVTASATGRPDVTCVSTTPSCVVVGLVNGTAYRVQVTASNEMGIGSASNPSAGLVPAGPPSAPRAVAVTARTSKQVALRWRAPAVLNGAPIVDYTVQWSTRKTAGFAVLRDPRSPVTTASFTRPRTGVTLYLRVIAVNGAGQSVATAPIAVPAR